MWSENTFTTYGPTYWGLYFELLIRIVQIQLIVLLSHYFCSWRNSRPVLSATATKLLTFRDHLEICGLPRICFTAENTWQSFSNEPPPGIIIISVDSPVTRLHSTYNGSLTDPRIQSNNAQHSQGSNALPINHKRKLYQIISILYIYIYIYLYTHAHTYIRIFHKTINAFPHPHLLNNMTCIITKLATN